MLPDKPVRLRAVRSLWSNGQVVNAGAVFTLPAWQAVAAVDSGRAEPLDVAERVEIESARQAERAALLGRLQREARAI
jgi:hypothetical protein